MALKWHLLSTSPEHFPHATMPCTWLKDGVATTVFSYSSSLSSSQLPNYDTSDTVMLCLHQPRRLGTQESSCRAARLVVALVHEASGSS